MGFRWRSLALLLLVAPLLVACGGSDDPEQPDEPTTTRAGTCWEADMLGDDPQQVLAIANRYEVPYEQAAVALAGRPALTEDASCNRSHAVEVFDTVRLPDVTPNSYAPLLRPAGKVLQRVGLAVERACQTKLLTETARAAKLPRVVATPALPSGMRVGWAPPLPDQWDAGQRNFACVFVQSTPSAIRYADFFTEKLPTQHRICIDSTNLTYVDCARKHDREVIGALDLTEAVAAGRVKGAGAISTGPDGRFVDLGQDTWENLDRACATLYEAISSVDKLTGVAQADAKVWPNDRGDFVVNCEADVQVGKQAVVRSGSVFDKKP